MPAVTVVLALVIGGIAVPWGTSPAWAANDDPVTLAQVQPSARESVPSALSEPTGKSLPEPLINTRKLISGGPPPDGIPAIDRPRFERAATVDWLDPREPVLAFAHGTDARAYPIRILMWHEIVNDTVDGIPVAITYCPLCNSAIAFDRRAAGRVLDFGTSGMLFNSDLVMYDRQTESLWPQFEGRAVAGTLTGTDLAPFPVSTVAWRDWRQANPDGWVLSQDTGHERSYGTNPYEGYDVENSRPFLYSGKINKRLAPKARVVGFDDAQRGLAVPLNKLSKRAVMHLDVAGDAVVVWWKSGTTSALDTGTIRDGRDVGAVQSFAATVDGQTLRFAPAGDGEFRDQQTSSTWDFFGHATSGPLAGRSLTPVEHLDTFWFSWSAFHPKTTIITRDR